MVFGGFGGDHIPQAMLQTFLNIVEFGLNPQEAVEEPRFYTYNFPSSNLPIVYEAGVMRAEQRISQEAFEALQGMGHNAQRITDWFEGACLYGAIVKDQQTGILRAGADPRGEAYAIGY
jgi:gamma-glutamyltranspeptidase/glutathione hydrolase